jgi:tetratricopeptide (TPR) repeat protein
MIWSGAATAQERAQQIFAEAVSLHNAGELDRAIERYLDVLKISPDNLAALSNLGAVYARKGEYGRAIEKYSHALAIDENVSVRFNLALAYYNSAQGQKAATELSRVIAAEPDNYRAALLLSDCYLRAGENTKVIDLLAHFENAHQDDRALSYLLGTALIRAGQLTKGQVLVDRVLGQGNSAEARLLLATAEYAARDFKAAAKDLAQAAELNSQLPGVHALYGRVQLALGNTEAASAAFDRELTINPTDYDSNLYKAVIIRKDQKLDEALQHLRRALQIRPGALDARYQIGSLLLSKGELPEAQQLLEQLVRDAPSFTEAHVSLATLYYRLNRRDDGERESAVVRKLSAEAQARNSGHGVQSTATKPKEPTFGDISNGADAAREADRADEAIALYNRGLQMNPNWTEGLWHLGTLLYEAERWSEARAAFQKLTELKTEAGISWAMVGLCDFRLGDYAASFQHLQRARSLGLAAKTHLSTVTRFHYALLLNRGGDHETALQVLYAICRDEQKTPALVEALGIAGLALRYLPSELPAGERELVMEEGEVQYLAGTRKVPEAIKAINAVIARHPRTANLHYTHGVLLVLSDSDAAIHEFKREIEISPSHVSARLQIAFEYIKRGEYDQALPFAEEAMKLAPSSFAARNAYGRALLDTDHINEAIAQLEAGLSIAPDSPETWYALTRAYTRAGRKDDANRARAEFQRLEKLKQIKLGHAPAGQS